MRPDRTGLPTVSSHATSQLRLKKVPTSADSDKNLEQPTSGLFAVLNFSTRIDPIDSEEEL